MQSAQKKASVEICKRIDCFLEALTPDERKQWEAICDLRSDMSLLTEEDSFIHGFRLGARMIMDVVGEYKGQFIEEGE